MRDLGADAGAGAHGCAYDNHIKSLFTISEINILQNTQGTDVSEDILYCCYPLSRTISSKGSSSCAH